MNNYRLFLFCASLSLAAAAAAQPGTPEKMQELRRLRSEAQAAGIDVSEIKAPAPVVPAPSADPIVKATQKETLTALIDSCKLSCASLSAADVARILGPLTGRDCLRWEVIDIVPHRRRCAAYSADYQSQALENALLPWEKLAAKDINETLLPSLLPANREIALRKWADSLVKKNQSCPVEKPNRGFETRKGGCIGQDY